MTNQVDEHFHILPRNAVISVFSNQAALDGVISALQQAGFAADKLHHRHGEEGLRLVDPDGSHHGLWARLLRSYQRLAGMEARLLEEVEAALKHGEYAVRVDTDGSETQRAAALNTMLLHTDKSIFYTGSGTITVLHVGKNYYNAQASYSSEQQPNH